MSVGSAPHPIGLVMTTTAVPTAFTQADPRTGKMCHTPSMVKANVSGSSRNGKVSPRQARKNDAIGMHIAAGLVNHISGVGRCSACGELGTLAAGGPLTLELAHDIPTSHGGAMCWCSMTLQHSACNKAMGDDISLSGFELHFDARTFASAGGYWVKWNGTRDSFDYDTFVNRYPKASANFDNWMPLTPAAELVQRRAMRNA